MELKISIVTCSDTRDLAQDEAGAALGELIAAQGWTVASHVVVRDDVDEIGDENQGCIGANDATSTKRSISQLRRNGELTAAANLHACDAFIPPADDLANA